MVRLAFWAGLLMLLARPSDAFAQPCPSEAPVTRALVERFLVRPAHASSRQATGLTGASPGSIRLLQNGV